MDGPPPPPPPHGTNPGNTAGTSANSGGRYRRATDLPDGQYDIFIIPPHSSGSGFLYLPSLQCQRNSFLAGVVSTLAAVFLYINLLPVFKMWFSSVVASGGMGVSTLVITVAIAAWALGRIQSDGGKRDNNRTGVPGGDGPRSSRGNHPHGGGPGASGVPPPGGQQYQNFGGTYPGGGFGGPRGPGGPFPGGYQYYAGPNTGPPPRPPPHQHASSPPFTDESNRAAEEEAAAEAARKAKEAEEAARKAREAEEARKAREAEEARKAREAEEAARKAREAEEAARAEEEARKAKEAEEAAKAEQARKEEAEQKRKEWEKAREETRRKEEIRRKMEEFRKKKKEEEERKREQEEREAREQQQKREKEAREREFREWKEKRARERAEKEAAEKAAAEKAAQEKARQEAAARYAAAREAAAAKRAAAAEAAKATAQSTPSTPQPPSPEKKIPGERAASVKTETEDDTYSFRPYDRPRSNVNRSNPPPSVFSESSYAPSQTTAQTTPPPFRREPYTTKDPDKVIIYGVYAFNNTYMRTPFAQLVSGKGHVTDGLILRITTEGMFVDDDVRGVAQREWDIKAWTLKLVEVFCPLYGWSPPPRPSSARTNPFRFGTTHATPKPPTGEEADAFLEGFLKACKNQCRLGTGSGGPQTTTSRGYHVVRASLRDQEGKRYVFVLQQTEGWKVAAGLMRLRKSSQVRNLGVCGLTVSETTSLLGNLGI
ncbi:hypothetical protein VTO42DRAFT_17 [Malbranchea cinnamomea]